MLYDLTIRPFTDLFGALNAGKRSVVYILLGAAAVLGFLIGRRRSPATRAFRSFGVLRFPAFQNTGEEMVTRVLRSHFRAPDYHLMNHVTLLMDDGTTQVDHILVSRFGVFVIETKDYNGWIFANASDPKWTQVRYRRTYQFQNPIHQNFRHVLAVQNALEFLPRDAIKSIVVFCENAEFKTDIPEGVVHIGDLVDHLRRQTAAVIAPERMQLAVGRLEIARLALSGQTDVEHVESLRRRLGSGAG